MIARASARIGISIVLASTAASQVTQKVTLGSDGVHPDLMSDAPFSISQDGRYVTFMSPATNVVPGDTNGTWDVFLRDRVRGTTERVSVGSGGIQSNGESNDALSGVTANGQFVVFSSWADNLVPGDTNGTVDAFVRDRAQGTTERVSVSSSGVQANGTTYVAGITPDGRFVLLAGWASNLVAGDTNGGLDVFVHDRQSHTTERVSVGPNGAQGNHEGWSPSISDDGRFVAFVSDSSNLIPGGTSPIYNVYVRDRQGGTTQLVSVDSNGAHANLSIWANSARISGDGRYVAFTHDATNLVPGDTNGVPDVFLHDRQTGTTELISVDPLGLQADGESSSHIVLSTDGRYVAFGSYATNLVVGDTNGMIDTFVRDRLLGATERVGVDSSGRQTMAGTGFGCMSTDGRFVTFVCSAPLVPDDGNSLYDGFLRDRLGGTDFTSLCDPGSGGVIPCPCGNPPLGPGRGCDNSAGTGGAILEASGGTFLSSDTLVFRTSGASPAGLSVVTQWTGAGPTGAILGMGVRCTSGSLRRLYTKVAVGGSIKAPDFGEGDLQVSVRSAALGDTILLGRNRWYVVYYRDPIVLGGCPATSTFNATQTGQVTWSP